MKLSSKAENIVAQINAKTKLGDLRKMAGEIKKDHELALELWSTGQFLPRQLALLIMDKKQLSQKLIDSLDNDIKQHSEEERLQLIDWLMANQLSKDKKTIALMETWENRQSSLQRRIFWYHQARLRWVGQTPPPNSEELLSKIEERIEKEVPEVQWAMNFTAAQIGIFEKKYRSRCVALGERTGLYKDEIVAKNCTPNYLPKFIAIQADKLKK
ncbi:DNA alkylation repair protein [Niabella beijingensis]|uniref:DNA alkylation repair protein n=1 Tax=Niabella beijingensis TaxID=2872700 RepID=UPI001CBC0D4E|nr:DNA alkylation repair protein [Niabella beijingensis]MBZ4192438.1 DNA alkylation repair protein [Niabella beijingensis]